MFFRFLGCSSLFLRLFDVQAIFFPLSKILNAKMHARMLWRRLRIALSFSLNFSFSQNETAVSFGSESALGKISQRFSPSKRKFKTVSLFKMFHCFIEDGLIPHETETSRTKLDTSHG
jgi:hypothetical protein